MSIIYDALQKTQRSREYLKLHDAITPHQPHRRNIKWMVVGSLTLFLSAGLGGLITVYWPLIKSVRPSATVSAPRKTQSTAEVAQQTLPAPSAHLWVTDSTPSSEPLKAAPKPKEATAPKILAESASSLVSSSPSAPQAASMQQEISTAIHQGKMILNGVMISGSERVVLINNQPLHVGDVVDGMKIVGIEFNAIKFLKDQKVVEMKVPV